MNQIITSLFIPFCSNLCIILNLYNGDILGVSSNIEYILWFIPHLFLYIYLSYINKNLKLIPNIIILILSIIINIYWIFAWEYDKRTNYRHRTELYDCQTFIAIMIFITLYDELKNTINKKYHTEINDINSTIKSTII